MGYDDWKLENDRDSDDPRGVSDRRGDRRPRYRCVTCGTRFDLGPATTHANETGHRFTYQGHPVLMGGPAAFLKAVS
jgi:DNA-directed RNA polymerase subunit RPC12/RpoP